MSVKPVEQSLFSGRTDGEPDESVPLAERLRPRTLDEVVGQGHLVGEGKILRGMIERDVGIHVLVCVKLKTWTSYWLWAGGCLHLLEAA